VGVATTPAAFRASVEARLRNEVRLHHGRDINRRRVLLVMERFIARLTHMLPDTTLLKGGLALELRLDGARTTRDIDVRVVGNPTDLAAQLRAVEAFRPDPEDFIEFAIAPDPAHPKVTGAGVKYDGFRFKVKARIAGRPYAAFGLDIAFGDPIFGEPDVLEGSDFFDKYGIAAIRVRTYPPTTHLAEKLHAYTLPRERVNTRLKDLVDMPLIATALGGVTASELRAAFSLTFDFRGSHNLPARLPEPPQQWLGPYDRLVNEEGLAWESLEALHAAAAGLIDPVLGEGEGTWSSGASRWLDS
jgi:hypothetical protein